MNEEKDKNHTRKPNVINDKKAKRKEGDVILWLFRLYLSSSFSKLLFISISFHFGWGSPWSPRNTDKSDSSLFPSLGSVSQSQRPEKEGIWVFLDAFLFPFFLILFSYFGEGIDRQMKCWKDDQVNDSKEWTVKDEMIREMTLWDLTYKPKWTRRHEWMGCEWGTERDEGRVTVHLLFPVPTRGSGDHVGRMDCSRIERERRWEVGKWDNAILLS